MELRIFVQWCVNQYLNQIDIFKKAIYEKDGHFQPGLIERERLVKLIYLTALYNGAEIISDGYNDILKQIEVTVESLYEKIYGTWRGRPAIHINMWRYQIDKDYEYDCFFFMLFILELFLRREENAEEEEWIEESLLNIPLQCELNYPEGSDYSKNEAKIEKELERLIELLKENHYIFEPADKNSYRVDYLNVYSFYQKYFFMNKYKMRKNELRTVAADTGID